MASRPPTAPDQAEAAATSGTSSPSSSPTGAEASAKEQDDNNDDGSMKGREKEGRVVADGDGDDYDDDDDDDEDKDTDIPLTMAASVVLADLPRSAAAALEQTAAGAGAAQAPERKVVVRFKAVGAAPQLAQDVCKISGARRFEEVVRYLRRKLRCGDGDSVFLYVNSAFAPSLDEVVGNLHQCFKSGQDQLVVAYSMTPAFG